MSIKPLMPTDRYIIDIDFDFFVREDAGMLLDGHNEALPPAIQNLIWRNMLIGHALNGRDMVADSKSTRDLSPHDFAEMICGNFQLSETEVYFSDSHAWVGAEYTGWVNWMDTYTIVHFDAHHDLDYRNIEAILDDGWDGILNAEAGQIDCGNWLSRACAQLYKASSGFLQPIKNLVVVYPNWRRDGDDDGNLDSSEETRAKLDQIMEMIDVRVHWVYFDEFMESILPTIRHSPVDYLTMCLSSAWTPPWFDGLFIDFIDRFVSSCASLTELDDPRLKSFPREFPGSDTATEFPATIQEFCDLPNVRTEAAMRLHGIKDSHPEAYSVGLRNYKTVSGIDLTPIIAQIDQAAGAAGNGIVNLGDISKFAVSS